MKLRLAAVFVACLAVASLAHAACLTCIGIGDGLTTPLPFQVQGLALRLWLGKGKPLPRQCAASVLLKKS